MTGAQRIDVSRVTARFAMRLRLSAGARLAPVVLRRNPAMLEHIAQPG